MSMILMFGKSILLFRGISLTLYMQHYHIMYTCSTLSPIIISCTWKDVDESLNLLCIKAPDALAAMKYCLTYIKDGMCL